MNYFNRKNVLIGALLLVVLIGGIIYFKLNSGYDEVINKKNTLLPESEKNEKKVETSGKVKAEVKGEVASPGVYELEDSARLQDLVDAAGGFKDSAYYDNINLSKKIKDEMVLFVYSKTAMKNVATTKKTTSTSKASTSQKASTNENTNNTTSASEKIIENKANDASQSANNECVVPDYNIESCIEKKESIIVVDSSASSEGESTTETGNNTTSEKESGANTSTNSSTNKTTSESEAKGLVNINTAGIKELTTLTGIGEAKAQKIIDYRNANGLFKSIEDITKVSGIGKATYEKFKANITI